MYVVFVPSISTLAKSKSADLFDCIELLIFIVLLYFLLSLSIQFVVYAPLYLYWKDHISKVSDVSIGFILFQYWVFLFPFGYKSNKLFMLRQGSHLFVFLSKDLIEFFCHLRFIHNLVFVA